MCQKKRSLVDWDFFKLLGFSSKLRPPSETSKHNVRGSGGDFTIERNISISRSTSNEMVERWKNFVWVRTRTGRPKSVDTGSGNFGCNKHNPGRQWDLQTCNWRPRGYQNHCVESYYSRWVKCAGNPNNFVPGLWTKLFSTGFQECKVTC